MFLVLQRCPKSGNMNKHGQNKKNKKIIMVYIILSSSIYLVSEKVVPWGGDDSFSWLTPRLPAWTKMAVYSVIVQCHIIFGMWSAKSDPSNSADI